jgi:hypothetical protein
MLKVKPLKQYLTELLHLSDAFDKKGADFVQQLISQHVVVSVKVDSASLVVMNDNGTLRFYGRNGAQEIDLIKRTGFDFYEKAINHCEKMQWRRLPSGVQFFMEMFSDILNPVIKYATRPRNDLILLFAKRGGKILRPDDPMLWKAAEILQIGEPPLIFSGKLDQDQKEQIFDFISAEPSERKRIFGGDDFKYMILSMFAVPRVTDYLIKNGLEGIVLYFGNSDEPTPFKIVDPKFTEKVLDKMDDSSTYLQDLYDMAFNNAVGYASQILNHEFKMSKTNVQQDYVEFVGQLTKRIVDSQGKQILSTVGKYQTYVQKTRYSGLNMNLAPTYILAYSKKFFFVDDLFRTLLFSLQKSNVRSNPAKGITVKVKDALNTIATMLKAKGLV